MKNLLHLQQRRKIVKNLFEILKTVALFERISESDLEHMLKCLDSKQSAYEKNDIIFLTDDPISQIGIILSGNVQIIKEDYLGNSTILTELSVGDIFGETIACAGVIKSPVTVLAITQCEVLFIDYKKVVTTCSTACIFHTRLIENMLKLLASKNLMLNQKIELISKRTTREKLISYFALQTKQSKRNTFTIPFTRHELADYLCVDRSAMSRELSKMRDEGILNFKGNQFEMLQ